MFIITPQKPAVRSVAILFPKRPRYEPDKKLKKYRLAELSFYDLALTPQHHEKELKEPIRSTCSSPYRRIEDELALREQTDHSYNRKSGLLHSRNSPGKIQDIELAGQGISDGSLISRHA